jgi:hypothetical protein
MEVKAAGLCSVVVVAHGNNHGPTSIDQADMGDNARCEDLRDLAWRGSLRMHVKCGSLGHSMEDGVGERSACTGLFDIARN